MAKLNIELVDKMGSDLTVSNVARVSFNRWKDSLDKEDVKLISYLAEHRHLTPFRHPQITLRCSAPIFIVRQLGKHQVGLSWNEVSRRYVDVDVEMFEFDSIRSRPNSSIKQGSGAIHPRSSTFLEAIEECELAQIALYNGLLDEGVAPEQARAVLPQSMMTTWIWTGSLAAFAHVYNERSSDHAQKEVQVFAELLDEIVCPLFPVAWEELTKRAKERN